MKTSRTVISSNSVYKYIVHNLNEIVVCEENVVRISDKSKKACRGFCFSAYSTFSSPTN